MVVFVDLMLVGKGLSGLVVSVIVFVLFVDVLIFVCFRSVFRILIFCVVGGCISIVWNVNLICFVLLLIGCCSVCFVNFCVVLMKIGLFSVIRVWSGVFV